MHIVSAGCRHFPCAACRTTRKSTERLRAASAASVSAELFMIAQTSEQRTLLTFCSAFAKCPKYGERLGAITQGEDLTSGTLRCAGVFCKFAAGAQCAGVFASLRREHSAQAFSRLCGGSAVRSRFRVFAAGAQCAVVFVCLRRERSAQAFSHLRAYLPPFVNGVPGNTGSLK